MKCRIYLDAELVSLSRTQDLLLLHAGDSMDQNLSSPLDTAHKRKRGGAGGPSTVHTT